MQVEGVFDATRGRLRSRLEFGETGQSEPGLNVSARPVFARFVHRQDRNRK